MADQEEQPDGTELYTLRKGAKHSAIVNGNRVDLVGGDTTYLTANQAQSFGDKFIKGDHQAREQDDVGGRDTTPPGGIPENIDQSKVAVPQAGNNQPPQALSTADPKVPAGQTVTPVAPTPAPTAPTKAG